MGLDLSWRANRAFIKGLARAFAGAIVFSLPIIMTMEMWELAFYMQPLRLALLLVLVVPLLIGLSHFVGFEETFGWKDDVVDAFAAYAVGFVAAAPVLVLFGVITWDTAPAEALAKVALQAVAGSIGALLAQSELGANDQRSRRKRMRAETYPSETFFMAVGAVFLSLNIAPTEEIVLIAYQMTPWHALSLCLVSLLLMHAFVYLVEFQGQSAIPEGTPRGTTFLRYTVVGYAICLAISAYILWTFGRTDGLSPEDMLMATIVLAFPAAIGAAAARLIL
jgi:putative integral membrane protein (TIGR02587 family)